MQGQQGRKLLLIELVSCSISNFVLLVKQMLLRYQAQNLEIAITILFFLIDRKITISSPAIILSLGILNVLWLSIYSWTCFLHIHGIVKINLDTCAAIVGPYLATPKAVIGYQPSPHFINIDFTLNLIYLIAFLWPSHDSPYFQCSDQICSTFIHVIKFIVPMCRTGPHIFLCQCRLCPRFSFCSQWL